MMKPMKNPMHIPEEIGDMTGGIPGDRFEYHSDIFMLSKEDHNGDHYKYSELKHKFMASDSKLIHMDTTKTWTKEGDLMVQVEYIKALENEGDEELEW